MLILFTKNTKKLFIFFFVVLSSLFFVMPVTCYMINLVQPFALHAIAGYCITGLLALFYKKYYITYAAFLAACIVLIYVYPFIAFSSSKEHLQKDLKVAHFNVLKYNTNYHKLIGKAKSLNAGFLSFQEVDRQWSKHLKKALHKEYPYMQLYPQEMNCYGYAVFSKYKPENVKVRRFAGLANFTGTIKVKGEHIHIITAHTKSPVTLGKFRRRNRHIRELKRYCKKLKHKRVLLAGDLNIVPWDKLMLRFKTETGLCDSRKSLTPTFPAIIGDWGLPLDYILHSPAITCTAFKAVKNTASDHYGITGSYKVSD